MKKRGVQREELRASERQTERGRLQCTGDNGSYSSAAVARSERASEGAVDGARNRTTVGKRRCCIAKVSAGASVNYRVAALCLERTLMQREL